MTPRVPGRGREPRASRASPAPDAGDDRPERALAGHRRRSGRRALTGHRRRRHPVPGRQARSQFGRLTDRTRSGRDDAGSAGTGACVVRAGRGRHRQNSRPSARVKPPRPKFFVRHRYSRSMLLRRRLLLLFVGIVAAVLALGVFMVLTLRERDDAQQRERELSVAVERVAQLSTAYADQETGERGYVLTEGDETFLEPYDDGRAAARRLVRQLRTDPRHADAAPRARRGSPLRSPRGASQAAGPEIAARAGAATWRVPPSGSATGGARTCSTTCGARRAGSPQRVQAEEDASRESPRRHPRPAQRRLRRDRRRGGGRCRRGGMAHPAMGDAPDRRARRRGPAGARRARSTRRSGSRARRSSRRWRSTSTRCAGASANSSSSRSARARRSSRARRWCSRCGRSSSRSWVTCPTVGPSPARLRAAEGVVAGDCYDLFTTRDGGIALVVVDIAGHGATEGILALRCKEMLRTALTSGDAPGRRARHDRRDPRRHGRRGVPHRVRRRDRHHRRPGAVRERGPPACVRDRERRRSSSLEPTGPLVGLLAPGWETAEAVDAARRQPLRLHRRSHRDPQRRERVLRSRATGGAAAGRPLRRSPGGGEALHRRGRALLARRTPRRRHDRRIVSKPR